jgi:protein involved in polysaccharide export with SLBB domain
LISGETLTLSSAVLRAGGWGTYANQRKVQLARVVNGQSVIKIYDVKEILKKGDAKLDPVLQDGDRIMVPRLGFVL